MAQLPNIIEKKRSIWRVFWYTIKYSYKSAPVSFVFLCIFTSILATIGFLNSYNFGQILTILSKPEASFIKILTPLFFVLLFDYLPGPLGFIRASFREHNQRAMKRGFEQDYIQKQADLDIATIEQPEYQDIVYQVRSRGESSMFDIVGWFFTLFNDTLRIFIAFGIIFNFTKIGLVVIIISSIPVYFYEAWRGNNLAKLWTERSEFNRKAGTKISPFLGKSSVLEIKFFDAISFFKEKILFLRQDFDKLFTKDDIKTSPVYAISSIFSSIGIAVTVYFVLKGVMSGIYTLGALSFVWGSIWNFSSALGSILRSIGRLSEHKIHANKFIDLYEMKPYLDSNEEGLHVDKNISYTLEFQNVSFIYPGSQHEVLKNISCIFTSGNEIAIVGLNGAGKTTLLRLITRVYDPTKGKILLNGKDLKEYSLDLYRKILGVMLQDYSTYSDETIQDNIIMREPLNKNLLEEIARQTGVSEYVQQYEKGFQQMIGTEFRGGVELSKGQKQKLALARVFYRNAPIMILDEPTAAIDALSEDTIFKSLREKHGHQTRIIISHKFSNVRDADQIILIEQGTIIEQGSHDELMNISEGRYKSLFELQAEGYK